MARALDPDFRLAIEEDFDPDAGRVPVISEVMGRLFFEMVGKACYATDEERRSLGSDSATYVPTLWLRTNKDRGFSRAVHSR